MWSRWQHDFSIGTERESQRRLGRRQRIQRRRIKRSNDHRFLDVVEVVAVRCLLLLVVILVTMTVSMIVLVVDAVHVRSSTGTTAFTVATKKKKITTTTTTTTKAFLFSSPPTPSHRRCHSLVDTSTSTKVSTKVTTTRATTGSHSPTSSSSIATTTALSLSTIVTKPRPCRCGTSLLATAAAAAAAAASPSSSVASRHQDNDENSKTIQRGLYIHIPYCRQRCHYCDFAIVPIGNSARSRTGSEFGSGSIGSSPDGLARNACRNQTTENGTSSNTHGQADGFRRMDLRYTDAVCKELRSLQQQKTTTIATTTTTNTSGSNTTTTKTSTSATTVETDPKIFISSLYFGGGTPSLMPVESIQRIVETACGTGRKTILDDAPNFMLTPDAEITIEMDPGTFTNQHLYDLKQRIGINRISLGVQSFDDQILTTMGRTHRSQDVYQSIEDIQQVFGPSSSSINYSIDLISGAVPGLTPIKWMLTLQHALTQLPIQPKHISIYDLQIEEGTKFAKLYGDSSQQDNGCTSEGTDESKNISSILPTDDDCAFMYKYTAGYLKAKGYEHYEVSSYALLENSSTATRENSDSADDDPTITTPTATISSPMKRSTTSPYRSRHNQVYWAYDAEWYALGLGASSFVNGRTLKRPRAMSDYIRWVDEIYDHHDDVQMNDHDDNNDDSTDDDRLADILLKRLRTSDGLDLNWISEQYGADTASKILKGCELGFELGMIDLVRSREDEGGDGNSETDDSEKEADGNQDNDDRGILKLRDPDGFIYSNYIISGIYTELGLL